MSETKPERVEMHSWHVGFSSSISTYETVFPQAVLMIGDESRFAFKD
ncbi:MAG: hypothetical protein ACC700_18045 [Anaerolineales bacterium]